MCRWTPASMPAINQDAANRNIDVMVQNKAHARTLRLVPT